MAWPQDAYVGQKVVRYRDGYGNSNHWKPNIGEVVIISKIMGHGSGIGIDLIEYPLIIQAPKFIDIGYNINVFRPVQTKSTEKGMAILKEILVTQKIKENV